MAKQPIVVLELNSTTQQYQEFSRNSSSDGFPFPNYTEARLCSCGMSQYVHTAEQAYYCPVDSSHCVVPVLHPSLNATPQMRVPKCLKADNRSIFARSIWPILIIWYGMAVLFCLCTTPGRNALDCMIVQCCSCYGDYLVNRMMQHQPHRVAALANSYLDRSTISDGLNFQRRRREEENDQERDAENERNSQLEILFMETELTMLGARLQRQERRPTELTLKTKIFKKSATNISNEQGEEDLSCTICFGPIEDGNRVGQLPCEHIFHVECLKEWLQRRNCCPLCMQANIATPRSPSTPPSGIDTTGDSSAPGRT